MESLPPGTGTQEEAAATAVPTAVHRSARKQIAKLLGFANQSTLLARLQWASSIDEATDVNGEKPPLPTRISPCPIIGAIVEVRFLTDIRPTVVPGLVYGAVRDLFPNQKEGPGAGMPEEVRAMQPAFAYQPVLILEGEDLSMHVGPKNFFLAMKEGTEYPGWARYRHCLEKVLERLKPLGVIKAPERLGIRYTDFFAPPLKERLKVDLHVNGQSKGEGPLQLIYQVRMDDFAGRVRIDTGAMLRGPKGSRPGIILDVDLGFSVGTEEFWNKVLEQFDKAHTLQKEIFYRDLLEPSFLASLNPRYD